MRTPNDQAANHAPRLLMNNGTMFLLGLSFWVLVIALMLHYAQVLS